MNDERPGDLWIWWSLAIVMALIMFIAFHIKQRDRELADLRARVTALEAR